MTSTPSMVTYEARVESFKAITKPKSKAKPAFPLDPKSYPHLTPNNLASSGFYHDPGEDEESWDTCKCYVCGLKLGGWDETDDPFEEHVKRGSCAWAEFVCQPKLHRAKGIELTWTTEESLPSSAESSKWRETTYVKAWPHKQKSGWLPTVKRLAQAGFVFNASTGSTDAVVCPLCDYSVEGWEATDDPWTIHSNKSPGCLFFTARVPGSSAQAVKGTKGKRTQRKTEAPSQPPEISTDNEEEVEASTSKTKPRKTITRAKGKKKVEEDTDIESQSVVDTDAPDIDGSEIEIVESAPIVPEKKTRPKRGKAKANENTETESQAESAVESHLESELESQAESYAESSTQPKRVKKSSRKTITAKSRSKPLSELPPSEVPSESEVEPEFVDTVIALPADEEEPSGKSKSTSSQARSKKSKTSSKSGRKTVISLDDIGSASGTDYIGTTGDEAMSDVSGASKRSRRQTVKSAGSKGSQKAKEIVDEMSVSEVEAGPSNLGKSTSSKSRSTKSRKAPARSEEEEDIVVGSAIESAVESIAASEAESVSAPSRSKSKSASSRRETIKSKSSKSSKSTKSTKSTKSIKSVKSSSRSDEESAVESVVEESPVEAPPTIKKSAPSRKIKQPPSIPALSEPEPQVLSQLERFANVPPSSPVRQSEKGDKGENEIHEHTPRAKQPLQTSRPSRPSPHANLSRDQMDRSVQEGAMDARRVMDDLVANLAEGHNGETGDNAKGKVIELTEEQKKMTLEQLVRSEFERQHEVMKRQGEIMIKQWEERARASRSKIESL